MNKNLLQTLSQLAEQGEQLIPIAGYDGMHVKIHTVGSLNIVSERAQALREKYPNDPYLSERWISTTEKGNGCLIAKTMSKWRCCKNCRLACVKNGSKPLKPRYPAKPQKT